MEHLAAEKALPADIEVARALLEAVPDGGSARHGFDREIRAHAEDRPCRQRIVALAAAELHRTLRHPPHRAQIVDELRTRVHALRPDSDGREQLAVVQAVLRAMRRELSRAAGQQAGSTDVFLRAEPGWTWEGWTRHLLHGAAGPRLPIAGPDDRYAGLSAWHYDQLRAGDDALWGWLVGTYQATMTGVVRGCGVSAADVDEVVARAIDKARHRAVTRGSGPGGLRGERPHSVYAWLKRIARTTAVDHLRAESRRRSREQAALTQPGDTDATAGAAPPIDATRLSRALLAVINEQLAPLSEEATGGAIPVPDRSDLPDALVSPELARRVRNAEHDRRLVLVAAIHLVLQLGPDGLETALIGIDDVAQASSVTRTSFQLSRLHHDQPDHLQTPAGDTPAGDTPDGATARRQRNSGAESHQSRRNAPSVLYAAQHALRAWLDDPVRPGATDPADAQVRLLLEQAERGMLIEQVVTISEQLAGSLSTIRAFSPARCAALGDWADQVLAELAAGLDPDAALDADTGPGPDADPGPVLDATSTARIRTAIDGLIARFEQPPNAAIDRHRAALADPAGSLDHGDRVRLQTAIDHYEQLREFHDSHLALDQTPAGQLTSAAHDQPGSSLPSDQEVQP